MEKKHFLLLLSLSASTSAIGKAVLDRIKSEVDPNASPQWIDSRGIGVFISTDLPVVQIWRHAFPDSLTLDQRQHMKDLLIVQVGPLWTSPPGSKAGAWLNSRFPLW